jgi:asparagine synthetase B (glutamine-hydrolysing)
MTKSSVLAVQKTFKKNFKTSLGNLAGTRRALMFSGGFDSMLTALLVQGWGARVTAVTVRFDDFNPLTVAQASLLAGQLGLPHHIIHVTLLEFLSAFESLGALFDKPLSDLDLVLVYAALKKYDPRIGGKIFISGMGSDQWFGNESLKGRGQDLKDRLDQAALDMDAHHKVAGVHGLKFVFPFLSASILELSQHVPAALKKDKKLLRGLVDGPVLIEHRTRGREMQVPPQVRQLLVKVCGHARREKESHDGP